MSNWYCGPWAKSDVVEHAVGVDEAGVGSVEQVHPAADVELAAVQVHLPLDGQVELVDEEVVVLNVELPADVEPAEVAGLRRVRQVVGVGPLDPSVDVDVVAVQKVAGRRLAQEAHQRPLRRRGRGRRQRLALGDGAGLRVRPAQVRRERGFTRGGGRDGRAGNRGGGGGLGGEWFPRNALARDRVPRRCGRRGREVAPGAGPGVGCGGTGPGAVSQRRSRDGGR